MKDKNKIIVELPFKEVFGGNIGEDKIKLTFKERDNRIYLSISYRENGIDKLVCTSFSEEYGIFNSIGISGIEWYTWLELVQLQKDKLLSIYKKELAKENHGK